MADELEPDNEGGEAAVSPPAPVEGAQGATDKFEAFRDVDPASLIELPAISTPETHGAVLERMGAPIEPGAYGLDKVEGVDAATAAWADGAFRQAKLLPWQANAVAGAFLTQQSEMTAALAAEDNAAAKSELTTLAHEWGSEYAGKFEASRHALAALGVDHKAMSYLEGGAGVREAAKLGAFFASFMKPEDLKRGADFLAAGAAPAPAAPDGPRGMAARWYPNERG